MLNCFHTVSTAREMLHFIPVELAGVYSGEVPHRQCCRMIVHMKAASMFWVMTIFRHVLHTAAIWSVFVAFVTCGKMLRAMVFLFFCICGVQWRCERTKEQRQIEGTFA